MNLTMNSVSNQPKWHHNTFCFSVVSLFCYRCYISDLLQQSYCNLPVNFRSLKMCVNVCDTLCLFYCCERVIIHFFYLTRSDFRFLMIYLQAFLTKWVSHTHHSGAIVRFFFNIRMSFDLILVCTVLCE